MNMKNFKVPFVALMIIGLLVVTGCSAIIGSPKAAEGTGTLYVSINGAESKTILPAAKLDLYVITITDPSDNDAVVKTVEAPGSAGIVLPVGTYDILVEGYIIPEGEDDPDNYILVASDTVTGVIVAADAVTPAAVTLVPADTGVDGTFAWDFDAHFLDTLEIEIYEESDPTFDTPLLADLLALDSGDDFPTVGSVDLEAGVYFVTFEVEADGETYKWVEVLYLYGGLTSKYGSAEFETSEVPPEVYEVPAADANSFYLNLNNWKTVATAVQTTAVTGTIAADKLTVNFTVSDQRLNLKLSAAQTAILAALPANAPLVVEIVGTADPDTNFRYHIGDPTAGGSWNASGSFDAAPFSGVLKKRIVLNGTRNTATQGYLILQQRAAAATEVEIESVRIWYANLPDVPVSIKAIPLTSPLANESPQATISTAEYTGAVVWTYDDDGTETTLNPATETFDQGEIYTAKITLTGNTGYVFDNATADFFTVAGATSVEFDPDTKVVTAVFPAAVPFDPPFDITALTGITLAAGGDGATLSDTNTLVTMKNLDGSALFTFSFEDAGYTLTAGDTLVITYACIAWPGGDNKAHLVVKNNYNTWGTTVSGNGVNAYPQFEVGTDKTYEIPVNSLAANATGISFQNNDGDNAAAAPKYQVKIISVAVKQ